LKKMEEKEKAGKEAKDKSPSGTAEKIQVEAPLPPKQAK